MKDTLVPFFLLQICGAKIKNKFINLPIIQDTKRPFDDLLWTQLYIGSFVLSAPAATECIVIIRMGHNNK